MIKITIAYLITLFSISTVTLILFGYDFAVAAGQWGGRSRIPEYVLLTLSALGGALGAFIIMTVQRHKASNRKKHFHFVIYFSMIMNLITFVILLTPQLTGA